MCLLNQSITWLRFLLIGGVDAYLLRLFKRGTDNVFLSFRNEPSYFVVVLLHMQFFLPKNNWIMYEIGLFMWFLGQVRLPHPHLFIQFDGLHKSI